jgi:hypothetical protein
MGKLETNYIKFLGLLEGAKLDSDLKSVFVYTNDNSAGEVLKTTNSRDHVRYLPSDNSNKSFEIRWGLDFNDYTGELDHEGRIKATMDRIKSGEYNTENLKNFLKISYDKLGISKFNPDYVVRVGSTAKLASDLSEITSEFFGSKIIDLPKVEYKNAIKAINWKELDNQVKRQSIKTLSMWADTFFSEIVVKTKNNLPIRNQIKNAQSVESAKKLLMDNIDMFELKQRDSQEKSLVPFIVRSSGKGAGGVRSFWLPKYNYVNLDFENAVIDCLENDKGMLILDDNENSGTDIQNISLAIEDIRKTLDFKDSKRELFKFYVLYKMGKSAGSRLEYSVKGHSSIKHNTMPPQSAVKSFIDFINTGKRKDESISDKEHKSNLSSINVFDSVRSYYSVISKKIRSSNPDSKDNIIYKKTILSILSRLVEDEIKNDLISDLLKVIGKTPPAVIKYEGGQEVKLLNTVRREVEGSKGEWETVIVPVGFNEESLKRIDYKKVDTRNWTFDKKLNLKIEDLILDFRSRVENSRYISSGLEDLKKKYTEYIIKNKLTKDERFWPFSGKKMI